MGTVNLPLSTRVVAWAALLVLFFAAPSKAASGVQAWAQRHRPRDASSDSATTLTVDQDGNVIVGGYDAGVVVLKYSGGGTPLWTNRIADPAYAGASFTAVDGNGNVYALARAAGHDFVALAYSSAGVPLWTNFYNSPGNYGFPAAITADGSGNVFAVGASTATNPTEGCYATVAYSSSGTALWTNIYAVGGPLNAPTGVAVDGAGHVVVAGWGGTVAYSGSGIPLWTNLGTGSAYRAPMAVDGAGNVYTAGYGGAGPQKFDYDYITTAFSSGGTLLWTNRFDDAASQDDVAQAMTVDKAGHVFVSGTSSSIQSIATVAYSTNGVPLWTNYYNGTGNSGSAVFGIAASESGTVFITGYLWVSGNNYDYFTLAYSSTGLPLWTNRYNGSANGEDRAYSVKTDNQGNAFVTGYSTRTGTGSDITTIAYSSSGTPLWTNYYDGVAKYATSAARAVAVGSNGNVYLTGFCSSDFNTVAYSSAGVPLWTNRFNGTNNSIDEPQAIGVSAAGNVYVAGSSSYGAGGEAGTFSDFATVAYYSTGVPIWTNRFRPSGQYSLSIPRALALDNNGNIFITGSYMPDGSAASDYQTIALTSTGVQFWGIGMGAPGGVRYGYATDSDDQAQAIAVDGCGHVYVTGRSQRGSHFQNPDYDYATIAYSTNGIQLWTNRYNGPASGADEAQAVAVDGCANVYVTGNSAGPGSGNDYATIAYSSGGVPLWTNRYDGPGNSNDVAQAVAVDASGRVYVTGYSWGGSSGYDYATIAYSGNGTSLWTNRYNGPANGDDFAESIKVDLASGVIYVSGHSLGAGTGYDLFTIAYASDGATLWSKRYNGPFDGNDQMQPRSCLAIGPGQSVYVAGTSAENNSTAFALIKYVPAPDIWFTGLSQLAGNVHLTISAPSNIDYRLDASLDLVHWTTLTNFSGLPSSVQYTDALPSNLPRRFYRAAWTP